MKLIPLNTEFGVHIPIKATDEQKINLLKLSEYLWALPDDYKHFDMGIFFGLSNDDTDWDSVDANIKKNFHTPYGYDASIYKHCGTAACAVGHGPNAGIISTQDDIDWNSYADRVFGCNANSYGEFMFGGNWSQFDNTTKGAALRIWYVLMNGFPQFEEYDPSYSYNEYTSDELYKFAEFFKSYY